jgi:NTP pyrophosphatase (non-canonical NTP hydrolase)
MASEDRIKKSQYIRTLELLAIIGEEFGELTQSINNYNWKGNKIEDLENSIEELQQMISPMMELEGLLEYMVKLKKNG